MADEKEIMNRMDSLLKMDEWLFKNVGDDVYTDIWLCFGLEDGGSKDLEILREYAEDGDLWLDCLSAFTLAVKEERKRAEINY